MIVEPRRDHGKIVANSLYGLYGFKGAPTGRQPPR